MFQQIITPRQASVVTVNALCDFARVDVPGDYTGAENVQLYIDAATDTVEDMAAIACLNEQILETYDFFPAQGDPRNILNYQQNVDYYTATPWWYWGFPASPSIDLVRRPVIIPSGSPLTTVVSVTYFDEVEAGRLTAK